MYTVLGMISFAAKDVPIYHYHGTKRNMLTVQLDERRQAMLTVSVLDSNRAVIVLTLLEDNSAKRTTYFVSGNEIITEGSTELEAVVHELQLLRDVVKRLDEEAVVSMIGLEVSFVDNNALDFNKALAYIRQAEWDELKYILAALGETVRGRTLIECAAQLENTLPLAVIAGEIAKLFAAYAGLYMASERGRSYPTTVDISRGSNCVSIKLVRERRIGPGKTQRDTMATVTLYFSEDTAGLVLEKVEARAYPDIGRLGLTEEEAFSITEAAIERVIKIATGEITTKH